MTLSPSAARNGRAARPARVALVASSYLPQLGGVEEHTRQLAARLLDAGHPVQVWTVDLGDGCAAAERLHGIDVRRLPTPLPATTVPALARFGLRAPAAGHRWLTAHRRFKPDLLHVHCFGPNGVYADRLAALTRTPLIVSLHGETFMDDHDIFGRSRLMSTALRASLRRAAAVTGCSQMVLNDAIERFGLAPGGGSVVWNGVDFQEQAVQPADWLAPAGPYLLAMGRLVANKGFDLLIHAFAAVADDHPDLNLIIAGEGPARAQLQHVIEVLGLADRARLPGRADRATVAALMANAELFVMPSRVEPFGIVVLEAWRAGVPVIASSRGGAAEFMTDGTDGLLVDPVDTAALSAAITSVVVDPRWRRQLGDAGRARVRDFGIDRAVASYAEIYQTITDRQNPNE